MINLLRINDPEYLKLIKIPAEVYSRVVGYFRPVGNWNPGKQEEFSERKMYKVGGHYDGEDRHI